MLRLRSSIKLEQTVTDDFSRKIVFDRQSRQLAPPDRRSWVAVRALQAVHRLLAPFRYYGISRVHGVVARLANPKSITTIKEGPWEFAFPSRDYYWNRLLDASWHYEPEIDSLLRWLSDVPFIFVDLGANFGYWSTRIGAGLYGNHRAIAVEPSEMCFKILARNTEALPVVLHRRAIDQRSGERVLLYGDRHAGFSITRDWHGASEQTVDEVESVSIDDLLHTEGIESSETPVLVKLDIEGVELRALAGATRTIDGPSLFVIEESSAPGRGEALHYAAEDLGMTLFAVEDGRLVELVTAGDLAACKTRHRRSGSSALNIVATKSPVWLAKLRSLPSAAAR
jgi:FkbM family methyltransferase